MAIIDINPITKQTLSNTIQNTANEIERCMARWKKLAEKLTTLTTDDLTTLGYDETTRNYIGSFRVALENIEKKYQNETPTNSDDASYIINLLSGTVIW